jgi:tRNA dimethylallyltransferase
MSEQVVALVGATATGKTAAGEALADALGGEVVCADSRQVFVELEIGTGKPTPLERAARPHHLFGALTLNDRPSAGWYARACGESRLEIRSRGRLPILVGGSGLWLEAARQGLAAAPPHDPAIRARIGAELAAVGSAALHARLAEADPVTAARLAPGDRQRITRALEVWEATGRPLSWWHAHQVEPAAGEQWIVLELTMAAAANRVRIAERTRQMFAAGLIEETRRLVEQGLARPLRALRAVGYDEALDLLEGRIAREEAEARTTLRTAQLAKRQRTWFRNRVDAIRIEADDRAMERCLEITRRELARHSR